MKYRKKPVMIEAFRLGIDCIPDWFMEKAVVGDAHIYGEPPKAKVKTLEGTMIANYGDFIIKGIQGEIYPCKPDIFYATYEKIEEPENRVGIISTANHLIRLLTECKDQNFVDAVLMAVMCGDTIPLELEGKKR